MANYAKQQVRTTRRWNRHRAHASVQRRACTCCRHTWRCADITMSRAGGGRRLRAAGETRSSPQVGAASAPQVQGRVGVGGHVRNPRVRTTGAFLVRVRVLLRLFQNEPFTSDFSQLSPEHLVCLIRINRLRGSRCAGGSESVHKCGSNAPYVTVKTEPGHGTGPAPLTGGSTSLRLVLMSDGTAHPANGMAALPW